MPVTAKLQGPLLGQLFNKEIDWLDDTIKVMLCTSSYTPNQDTHDYLNDVTGEVSGTGYTAGGKTLTTKTATYNASTNTLTLDADDLTWTGATFTARYAVIYDDTPATAAAKPIIGVVDFGADVAASGGPFAITWDAAGIATASVA